MKISATNILTLPVGNFSMVELAQTQQIYETILRHYTTNDNNDKKYLKKPVISKEL